MEANLAVLIDFENIAAGTEKEGLGRFDVDAVLERVKDKGRVLVARSYADWGRFARFKQSLLTANVTMYELTSHGMQDKNRADIAMVVDALELAFTRDYIDTFVVVSGDSDFTPLVLKMRELNKKVIGCGTRSSTSRLLIQACDEFIFYDSIVKAKRQAKRTVKGRSATPSSKEAAFSLLATAVAGLLRENPDPPHASVVKSAMQRKAPDFSEADYGYGSLSKFLEAAQKAGIVKIRRDEKSGGYRVDLVESDTGGTGDEEPDVPEAPEGPWIDPYAPPEAEWLFHALAEEGYNPLAAPTRLMLLEALEQSVADRKKKRRRINIQFVREDVRRVLKKTRPEVPASAVRATFDALMGIHVFMHRDGTPVRTANANFTLDKNADQMNKALTDLYLETLKSGGRDLSDVDVLAELFLGDAGRRREIEETLAWLDQPEEVEEEARPEEVDLASVDDLDVLLEVDEPTGDVPEAEEAPEVEEPPGDGARAEAPVAEASGEGAADGHEAAPEDEAPPRKPRRRRTRKKKSDDGAEAEASG